MLQNVLQDLKVFEENLRFLDIDIFDLRRAYLIGIRTDNFSVSFASLTLPLVDVFSTTYLYA